MRKARMDFRTVAGDESDASGLFDTGHTPYQEYLTALSQVKGGLGAAPQVPKASRLSLPIEPPVGLSPSAALPALRAMMRLRRLAQGGTGRPG
jgi:hypothetical protein